MVLCFHLARRFALLTAQQEAQNGIITLNDEDPDRIKQFLQYLYVQDYDLLVTKLYPTDTDKVLLEHAEIYTLADRYGVPSLKKLASTRFKDCLPTEYASDKLSVEVIENVYASTVPQDRGLRAPLLDYLVRSTFHYDLLDDLYSTLESVDGLALELLCALWDYLHDDVGIRCTKCPDYSDSDIDVAARLTISDCGEHVTILCSRCGSGYDDMIVVFS